MVPLYENMRFLLLFYLTKGRPVDVFGFFDK
jgi:hypothetical protein